MVKDIKYILKRIIIGTGVVLLLSFIRGNLLIGVSAKQISSVGFGGVSYDYDASVNTYLWDVPNGSWANWGSGLLYGSVAVQKTAGSSTSHFSPIRTIISRSNNGIEYQCYFGSMSSNNSTFERQIISYYCPMTMGPQGLESLSFVLLNDGSADFSARMNINGTLTFVQDETFDTSGISGSINNQISNDNTNTQNIINNQNQNNQNIINNQNSNTDKEIESQQVCNVYDKSSIEFNKYYLHVSDGQLRSANSFGVSKYIKISSNSKIKILEPPSNNSGGVCFYNVNKDFISCVTVNSLTNEQILNVPSSASYIRFTVSNISNKPQLQICKNGNQGIADSQEEINNTLNDDNVDGANSQASSFFENFQNNDHGLSAIITSPLNFIKSLGSSSCTPLKWKFGWFNDEFTLPCATSIISSNYPEFLSIYQTITFGIIAYVVIVRIFALVKGFKDPDSDKLEVLEL